MKVQEKNSSAWQITIYAIDSGLQDSADLTLSRRLDERGSFAP
jgi:hypothetical protein